MVKDAMESVYRYTRYTVPEPQWFSKPDNFSKV